MQPAGNFVGVVVELGAGAELRQAKLEAGHLELLIEPDRNAAPVVFDRDAPVGLDLDRELRAVTGHGLVDRVVHDFLYEVVQAAGRRIGDVHTRTLTDVLGALEHLDLAVVVIPVALFERPVLRFLIRAVLVRLVLLGHGVLQL